MKVAFCASEVVPFAKTGGLADVAGALPQALAREGQEVIVIMPGYKAAHACAGASIKPFSKGVSVSRLDKNVKVYLIDNDAYFGRDALYGDKTGDYTDNLERFSYFCKRALELLKEIKFKADIIHCHDWQTGLIPVYLKTLYGQDQFFKQTHTVFTIHNIGYQGLFPKEQYPWIGIDWKYFTIDGLEYYDKINLLKGGLVFADVINTVSETYAKEIQTKEFGFGMEGLLQKRSADLFGIVNGLDYSIWNPSKDALIAKTYSAKNLEGKRADKEALQKMCKLPLSRTTPVFGIVSRLAQQKGFDILAEAIDTICKMKLQIVILGTGDQKYHDILAKMVKKYPKVICLHLKFDEALAHSIYAGSDVFLMPSKYEPCGLGQLISFAYGTVPLVYKTGGLADTVNDSNGFVFDEYSKKALISAIKKATAAYSKAEQWKKLVLRGMKLDFSWEESAKKYIDLYEKAPRA